MTSVDGDMGLLREVASIFKRDSLRTLSGLQAAIRNGDAVDLNRKAHALKGSAGAFGGHAAALLALALEEMGGRRDLAGAEELAGALALELGKLTQELDAYVGGIPS
jgi:HPt (histidine-containing phosphotransfer) domain-containing protein